MRPPGQLGVGRVGGGGGAGDHASLIEMDHVVEVPRGGLHILEGIEVGDAALRRGILLADGALELLGHILHHSLVQRNTGVELGGSGLKGIVGVAAGGTKLFVTTA